MEGQRARQPIAIPRSQAPVRTERGKLGGTWRRHCGSTGREGRNRKKNQNGHIPIDGGAAGKSRLHCQRNTQRAVMGRSRSAAIGPLHGKAEVRGN